MFTLVPIPPKTQEVDLSANSHRIFIIDCSGSMESIIDEIAINLKNKIPVITNDGDFLTIIWFNSRGYCGCLLEHVPVGSLSEIMQINSAIDRFLKADNGTYFTEAISLGNQKASSYPEQAQIFFMTDGCENNKNPSTEQEFKNCNYPVVIVEYGYYTDTKYLSHLASLCNAELISQNDFKKLNFTFDTYLKNKVGEQKGFKYESNNTIITFVDNNVKILKPKKGVHELTFDLTYYEVDTSKVCENSTCDYMYLGILYAIKSKDEDLAWQILKATGDVYFITLFQNCFSKQDKINFKDELLSAYTNPEFRGKSGIDYSFVPKDDCFTAVDLIQLLQNDAKTVFYPYHKDFKYDRISRKVENKDPYYFAANKDIGSKIEIVYNSTRANISFNCKVYGHNVYFEEDKVEPTETFRNFTIIKDGIKNVNYLPVKVSRESFDVLLGEGLVSGEFNAKEIVVLDISNLPVVNRAMTRGVYVCAKDYFELVAKKQILQSERKYLKSRVKMLMPKAEGEEKEGGMEFEKRAKSEDFYMSTELVVSIKGCSNIPTVNAKLLAKLDAGKATLSESLMMKIHEEFSAVSEEEQLEWCKTRIKELDAEIKGDLNKQLEKVKFAVLVGGKWFTDLDSLDDDEEEGSMDVSVNYKEETFEFTVTVKKVQKKIEL